MTQSQSPVTSSAQAMSCQHRNKISRSSWIFARYSPGPHQVPSFHMEDMAPWARHRPADRAPDLNSDPFEDILTHLTPWDPITSDLLTLVPPDWLRDFWIPLQAQRRLSTWRQARRARESREIAFGHYSIIKFNSKLLEQSTTQGAQIAASMVR